MLQFDQVFANNLSSAEPISEGAMILRSYASAWTKEILIELPQLIAQAPLRRMQTAGGRMLSVQMSNCGGSGWVSDRHGYRYEPLDPLSQKSWPPMPDAFLQLATQAAAEVGYHGFKPDSCLINCYEAGTGMSLHQDKDEADFSAPIVSVSLGLPIIFLWGGLERSIRPTRIPLDHGDVVVWGGSSRLFYHGVAKLKDGVHPLLGRRRINLTFRKVI